MDTEELLSAIRDEAHLLVGASRMLSEAVLRATLDEHGPRLEELVAELQGRLGVRDLVCL